MGVWECEGRDDEFRLLQGEETPGTDYPISESRLASKEPEERKVIEEINEVLQTRNFEILRKHVPDQALYYWTDCGPGDAPSDELYFEEIQSFFLRESRDVPIYINPQWEMDWGDKGFSIETEGWNGEYPYFAFHFSRTGPGKWEFSGGCSNPRPILNQPNGGYGDSVVYFRTPDLPRPGARLFFDVNAFHARIQEIIRFKVFEALRPYAVRGKLTNVTCDAYMTNSKPRGGEIDVDEAIRRLKTNAAASSEIKLRGAYGGNRYLASTGWSIDPYIYFGFSETPKGWEWTKIAFCKDDGFMRPPWENTGPHKPLMQHRMVQAAIAAGVIALITGLVLAYRNERGRIGTLAVADGREAAVPAAGAGVKKTLSGAIGIVLMLGLVLVSVWSFNQALTLEESAGASADEIGRYYLIQKISLAGIVAVLAALVLLNRKEKINCPGPRPKQIPLPIERIQPFLGPKGSHRRRYLLTMVPGLGQVAAGRITRGFLSVLAFPMLWGLLYLIYIDIESQFFSFPMYPVIPTLISAAVALTGALWVLIGLDAVGLNESNLTSEEFMGFRRPILTVLALPLIPIAAMFIFNIIQEIPMGKGHALRMAWGGGMAGLMGALAWSIRMTPAKILLFACAGFGLGLVSRLDYFMVPLSVDGFLVYRPMVAGLLTGLSVYILFARWNLSPLVIPAAVAASWFGGLLYEVMTWPLRKLPDEAWSTWIFYNATWALREYWTYLAIFLVIRRLNQAGEDGEKRVKE